MRAHKILITILVSIYSFTVNGQTPNFQWANSVGGTGNERGHSVTTDNLENIYTTGVYDGTEDFDPSVEVFNLESNGSFDIFIQKLDEFGDFVWAKSIGGSLLDMGNSILVDDLDGSLYITGYYQGTVDFDPSEEVFNLVSNGVSDIFVLKLDLDGNFIWAKSIGGSSTDEGNEIIQDNLGDIYVTGTFRSTVDFDPNVGVSERTSLGSDDVFALKLSSTGNFIWAKSVGGTTFDKGLCITTDDENNLYLGGIFRSEVDFDPSDGIYNLTSAGIDDVFIQKLDVEGNFVWAKQIGGTELERCNSITTDGDEYLYLTGRFTSTSDFDPGADLLEITAVGSYDIFTVKLNLTGDLVWAKVNGGSEHDSGKSIKIDALDNIYVMGNFRDNVDFDPGETVYNLTSNGSSDIFVQKLDTEGNLIWVETFGGTSTELARALCLSDETSIYLCGGFRETIDFDIGDGIFELTSGGDQDFYISKLVECTETITVDSVVTCDSYTWINDITYTVDTVGDSVVLSSITGCDSIVILNLTVNYFTEGIDTQVACDSFNWIDGETYTEDSFTATHTLTNAMGCDSIVTLNLIVNNSSVGTDIQTACNSFIWIDGIEYFEDNTTATYTLINEVGCDSVVTLDLVVNNIDIAVVNDDPNLTASEMDATYQWLDCLNEFSPILGANSMDFEAEENGDYAVEIMKYGCIDTSDCYTLITAGINEFYKDDVLLYPNPTTGKFYMNFPDSDQIIVNFYASDGRQVYSETFSEFTDYYSFEIDGESGIYFIEIISVEKGPIRQTIIKQ